MAKFNLSRFNLGKYNRSVDIETVYDKMQIDARFLAQVGLGQSTKDALKLDAAITGQMKGAAGTLEHGQFDAAFLGSVSGRYIAYGHDVLDAAFDSETHMAAVVQDKTTWSAEFTSEAYLSPQVRDIGTTMEAAFGCKTYLGNIVMDPDQIMAYGIFGAVVSAEALEEIVLDLSVTIRPGDILTIDSDNFRVLLNGSNAIKYHSGDWIDELNRNSKSITITGGGSSLQSSIYFQELWL